MRFQYNKIESIYQLKADIMKHKLLLLFLSLSTAIFTSQQPQAIITNHNSAKVVPLQLEQNRTSQQNHINHEDIHLSNNTCCIIISDIAKTASSFKSDCDHYCLQGNCTPNPANQNLDRSINKCRAKWCACLIGSCIAGGISGCVSAGPVDW